MSETTDHPLEAILRMCADAAPAPWYPKAYAQAAGVPAGDLLYFLEQLWWDGLIQRTGGSSAAGPGFTISEAGRRVLEDPALLERLRAGTLHPAGDRGTVVRDAIRNPRRPVASRVLLAANLLVFAYGFYLAGLPGHGGGQAYLAGSDLRDIRAVGGLNGGDVVRGDWWRLLAAGFVHIGLLHLGVNMYALYVMGPQVEAMWGCWRFLLIYFASLLAGSCAMVASHPEIPVGAGASGALCGLFGSEAVWLFLNRRYFPWALVARWRSGLTTNLLLLVFISLIPGVSGWAHLGGALAGGASGWLLHVQRFGRAPWRWLALAGLIPVCAAGLVALDRERASQPAWQRLEVRDFWYRFLKPARETTRGADRLYNDEVLPLLERHPERRDPAAVAPVRTALNEQLEAVDSIRAGVARARPYRHADAEQLRQLLLGALDAERAMLAQAVECLDKGAACTPDDEKALERTKEKAEADWARLGK